MKHVILEDITKARIGSVVQKIEIFAPLLRRSYSSQWQLRTWIFGVADDVEGDPVELKPFDARFSEQPRHAGRGSGPYIWEWRARNTTLQRG
jgi:hypothetical protein